MKLERLFFVVFQQNHQDLFYIVSLKYLIYRSSTPQLKMDGIFKNLLVLTTLPLNPSGAGESASSSSSPP